MKWIKASERLPEINKNVIMRFPWLDNTIVLDEGKLKPKEELDNQLWFSTNNYGSIPEQEDGLEWIDESAPSPLQEAVEFAEWIRVELWNPYGGSMWKKGRGTDSSYCSSHELYHLFLQSKNKPK